MTTTPTTTPATNLPAGTPAWIVRTVAALIAGIPTALSIWNPDNWSNDQVHEVVVAVGFLAAAGYLAVHLLTELGHHKITVAALQAQAASFVGSDPSGVTAVEHAAASVEGVLPAKDKSVAVNVEGAVAKFVPELQHALAMDGGFGRAATPAATPEPAPAAAATPAATPTAAANPATPEPAPGPLTPQVINATVA